MNDKIPENFYRVSAKALILDNNKRFLLAQEKNWAWELPWGGIDFWESANDCIKRELEEEMWLSIQSIKGRPSYFLTTQKRNWIWIANIIFETKVDLNDILNFSASDECQKVRFVSKEEALQLSLQPNVNEFVKIYNPDNH